MKADCVYRYIEFSYTAEARAGLREDFKLYTFLHSIPMFMTSTYAKIRLNTESALTG